jgi:hypothetical protein
MTTLVQKWTDLDGDGLRIENGVADEGETTYIPYAEFSNEYFGPDPEGTEWRVPTLEEWQAALEAGVMLHADFDPDPDVFLNDYPTLPFHAPLYTGTFAQKTRGGFNSGYVINVLTGEVTDTRGAIQGTIPVRAPKPADKVKGGKGK